LTRAMPEIYQNFDTQIIRDGDGYAIRVIHSPVGESAPLHFELPFTAHELRSFFWLAGRVRGAPRAGATVDEAPLDPQRFGVRLYQAIFGGEAGALFLRSLDAAERAQQGLRIRLRLREVPELADLPWEYLYAPPLSRFPALSNRTPLVRYVEMARPRPPLRIEPPLSILAVIANPGGDVDLLDVDEEWFRLSTTLAPLQETGAVRLERLARATLPALQQRLYQGPVHVLHFIGHGHFDPEVNQGELIFESEDGGMHLVEARSLALHLHDHDPLRLVFLNACEGGRGGQSEPFAGVAQQLVEQGIPAVLAMQFEVSDRAAIALSHEFYRALAAGLPVDTATSEARKAVYTTGNPLEWATPVLFSRSDDNALFAPAPTPGQVGAVATHNTQIDTGGGSYVMGDVTTAGDFVARDKITQNYYGMTADEVVAAVERSQRQRAASACPDPLAEFQRLPFEPETLPVAAGPFYMGSDPGAEIPVDETPRHRVTLPPYRIGKTPVTNAQYAEFLKRVKSQEEPRRAGWFLREPPRHQLHHPVVGVSWHDAMAYCRWLSAQTGRSYRLPNEAEWEKASRGAGGWIYPWGNTWIDGRCNASSEGTTTVDAYVDGASPYGCLDMLGNAEEWTLTVWGVEVSQPGFGYPYRLDDGRDDPAADGYMPGLYRVVRGGSYRENAASLRCARRTASPPDSRLRWRGFRIVLVSSG
jgi:formylglycine-generating enzyme required for sulfatase activity